MYCAGWGAARASPSCPSPSSRLRISARLGRPRRDLESLEVAFEDVSRGRTVAFYIHGPSGVGKTALVRRFLDDLIGRDAAVVLAGRCYEQESVPYKALDSVVDALSQYLQRLPLLEAQRCSPRHPIPGPGLSDAAGGRGRGDSATARRRGPRPAGAAAPRLPRVA